MVPRLPWHTSPAGSWRDSWTTPSRWALLAVREGGATSSRDVAVVGFDDSPTAGILSPGLTSIAQSLEAVGRECLRLLLARMADPDAEPERILLKPTLVIRDSTPEPDA